MGEARETGGTGRFVVQPRRSRQRRRAAAEGDLCVSCGTRDTQGRARGIVAQAARRRRELAREAAAAQNAQAEVADL
jgi:hypothetical protein